ncbi:type II CRISPR-associated endonuclease Cas1 [Mycoplasma amphoriforme]|uniref:CRISPR-associated endonuclease Cas1 n=1 Tax=Mycoplasma amphoriforme A39 TaxID=572419 RepID=A0A292IJF1_9MOLU|nr:unnamed protein product [Mycoplasma amphoriforme A39]
MGWKIVEIENGNYLKVFLDNLVVFSDLKKITIPLSDIDTLLINNNRITMTTQLINKLSDFNILTIICNSKYLPNALILPITGNYNSLKIQEKQSQWTLIFKSTIWKQIIKQKIHNQKELLKKLLKVDLPVFDELAAEIKDLDISNREGHAAKIYWHHLFGIDFNRRDDHYINTLLNYGYGVLRAYVSRSIVKKGLDPKIGIFHKSFHNHFALSSDLMEGFRVIIDKVVFEIMSQGIVEQNLFIHKEQLVAAFNQKIKINNTFQYVSNAIDLYISSLVAETSLPWLEFFND